MKFAMPVTFIFRQQFQRRPSQIFPYIASINIIPK